MEDESSRPRVNFKWVTIENKPSSRPEQPEHGDHSEPAQPTPIWYDAASVAHRLAFILETLETMVQRVGKVERITDCQAENLENLQSLAEGRYEFLAGKVRNLILTDGRVDGLLERVQNFEDHVGLLAAQVGNLQYQVENKVAATQQNLADGQVGELLLRVQNLEGQLGLLAAQVGKVQQQNESGSAEITERLQKMERLGNERRAESQDFYNVSNLRLSDHLSEFHAFRDAICQNLQRITGEWEEFQRIFDVQKIHALAAGVENLRRSAEGQSENFLRQLKGLQNLFEDQFNCLSDRVQNLETSNRKSEQNLQTQMSNVAGRF